LLGEIVLRIRLQDFSARLPKHEVPDDLGQVDRILNEFEEISEWLNKIAIRIITNKQVHQTNKSKEFEECLRQIKSDTATQTF